MSDIIETGLFKAQFKGVDPSGIYTQDETYLLSITKSSDGSVLIYLATGKGKRNYISIEEYEKDWNQLENNDTSEVEEEPRYSLSITYNQDMTPNLQHVNSKVRPGDIIGCLETAKLQVIRQMTGGGKPQE